ncbi:uncharacterized protein E5676_scaffold232G00730 [Cucumis melo var. makuwa]|uniref:Uncharacterized protein n=1 Tax=Cucumis melo var. makuwa TaxID=1194695 RepID=A0A5D3BJ00_CUCMM|nr:uncharacterized protein E5676_scaffold232G00730 [Cucumis melo var. makuwa]
MGVVSHTKTRAVIDCSPHTDFVCGRQTQALREFDYFSDFLQSLLLSCLCIPHNLASMEKDYVIRPISTILDGTNYMVQDLQMGQAIGTDRKVGRLFELLSLQFPLPSSISAPVTDSDTY